MRSAGSDVAQKHRRANVSSEANMIGRIDDTVGFHQRVLAMRAYRQEMLAANIANANTPHYKARDIDFKASLQGAMGGRGGPLDLVRTAPRHLPADRGAPAGARLQYRTETQSSVDGNTVDMDVERAAFAENAIQYEASLTFINGMLRTLQTALQGQ
jgi:flagellar basal-body rod protein FlgB